MVFVLDTNKRPLAPCHGAVARKLLNKGRRRFTNDSHLPSS
ncbi:RRXRR domain-containing protein [Anoxybacillus flavithermus]|nr:RRXRR domain-containing protein [Anoxybacillus flavithermus]